MAEAIRRWADGAGACTFPRSPAPFVIVGMMACLGSIARVPLAVMLLVWAGLQGLQFLMLGAGADPEGAAWYRVRAGFSGRALAVASAILVALAAGLTLRPGENRTRLLAALAVTIQLVALFWFVTPAFRGGFRLTPADLLALAGIAGLAAGLVKGVRRLFPGLAVTPVSDLTEAAQTVVRLAKGQ